MESLAAQPHYTEYYDHELRLRNDTETWFAEVLPGSMRTPFEYTSDGKELYAEDGSVLGDIFADAIDDAREMAAKDPSLMFELRRRLIEADELADMLAMVRGEKPNTMVVESDFPPELMKATKDVGGYNVSRKTAMLRVITWDGLKLKLYSQSLDRSDRAGLEAIRHKLGYETAPGELLGQRMHLDCSREEQEELPDELTAVYDNNLALRHGGQWYAGRREPKRDTYSFAQQQHDLIGRYIELNRSGGISQHDRYNIAALLTKRFETDAQTEEPFIMEPGEIESENIVLGAMQRSLDWQLQLAGTEARREGRTFSGCGISANPDSSESSAGEQLAEAGYGNFASQDKYGSLKFDCPKCKRTNTRPRGKLIPHCQKCGADVTC